LEASVVLAEPAVLEVSEVRAVSAELGVLEVSAALAEREVMDGNIIQHIGAARRTRIVPLPTGLAVRLVVTRCLTARPAHGIRSGARAAMWAAIAEAPERAIVLRIPGWAITAAGRAVPGAITEEWGTVATQEQVIGVTALAGATAPAERTA
jgi:hypothetical protein